MESNPNSDPDRHSVSIPETGVPALDARLDRRTRDPPAIACPHGSFEQWGRILPEHTTAASILDRLLHHATIVVTSRESYRMRHADHKKGVTKS